MGQVWKLAITATLATLPVAAGAQDVIAGRKIYKTAEASIWAGAIDTGELKHLATGSVFPERLGAYKRARITAIDNGNDVSVNYQMDRDPAKISVTIFVFKPGDLPEHKLRGSINSIGLVSPETFLWSDGPFSVDAPTKLKLFKGTYKTGIGPNTIMDYLYFAPMGHWTVKVRATLPSPKDISEETAIDGLVRGLPWQTLQTANGACSGAACNVDGAAPFNSHLFEGMLARLVTTLRGKPDEAKLGSLTPLYSTKQGGAEWRVTQLDAKLAELFEKSYGAITAAAPLYTLVREEKGKVEIPRLFSGTPTEAQFKANVDALVTNPEKTAFVSPTQAALYQVD